MACGSGWLQRWFVLGAILVVGVASVAGCGGDDDNDAPGRYAGVTEWKCFEEGSSACRCLGTSGGGFGTGGNPVEQCAPPVCKSYVVGGESWSCECHDADFEPSGGTVIDENGVSHSDVSKLESVATCPPT